MKDTFDNSFLAKGFDLSIPEILAAAQEVDSMFPTTEPIAPASFPVKFAEFNTAVYNNTLREYMLKTY